MWCCHASVVMLIRLAFLIRSCALLRISSESDRSWHTPFLLLIRLLSHVCCSPTVCHYMVLPFGSSHVLPFTQSRSLLTTYMYSDASGIFHAIGTPEFNTLLLACPVCLMLPFLGQHPFCHLPSPAFLSLFGRFLVNLACWRTPILGIYNAMSGGLHAKQYYQEDGLCATVIRHLRVFGPLKDNDLNEMIDTICTS